METPIQSPTAGDESADRAIAAGFVGMDNATDPKLLEPGLLADGQNLFMKGDGNVELRPGLKQNCFASAIRGAFYNGYPRVRGLGFFSLPTKQVLFALSDGELMSVPSDGDNQTPTDMGATIAAASVQTDVPFVQMSNTIYYLSNGVLTTQTWNGAAWAATQVTTFSTGAAMPTWSRIATQGFRVFLMDATGEKLYASAIGAATGAANWVPTENIQVGSGEGDPARGLVANQSLNLTMLCARSVYLINTSNSTVANWTSYAVTKLTGCVEGKTAVAIGQDILFLSRYGIVSLAALTTTLDISKLATLSAPIQPYIDRINWSAISTAFAFTWRGLYCIALPLDANTQPQHILSFNLFTRNWMTPWVYTLPTQAQYSGSTTWAGFTCAVVANFSDKAETLVADNRGQIMRLDDTTATDEGTHGTATAIPSWAVTRAFTHDQPQSQKQPFFADLEFKNAAGVSVFVLLLGDGDAVNTNPNSGSTGYLTDFNNSGGLEKRRVLARGRAAYREAQLEIYSTSGRMRLRSAALSAFIDPPFFT